MLTKTEPRRPTIAVGGLFGFILLLPLQLMAAALHPESRKRFDTRPLLFPTVRDRLRSRCNAAERKEADRVGAYLRRKLLIIRSDLFRPTLTLFFRLCLLVFTYGLPLSSALGQLSTTGQWSATTTWPIEAIHATLLPTGKVLMWQRGKPSQPYLWDPGTNSQPVAAQKALDNMFCSGHALLADGQLLVTGGHYTSYNGIKKTNRYNQLTDSWVTGLPDMFQERWYPTTTALATGNALVISGQISGSKWDDGTYADLPQVWQVGSGTWRNLTKATLKLPYFPYMFVAPNGKVFMAGPDYITRYLDPAANNNLGGWTFVGNSKFGVPRNWGSAVMYQPGKVLLMGGAPCGWYNTCNSTNGSTDTAEIIDLTVQPPQTPQWRYTTAPMQTGVRKLHNATLLPNGKVLVTGGSRGLENVTGAPASSAKIASEPEMWDPTGSWAPKGSLASLSVFRGYHSIALLLPDGRVLSAGGDWAGTGNTNEAPDTAFRKLRATFEIYKPPYLFSANQPAIRPTINSVPPNGISYGQSFSIGTPNPTTNYRVTMVGLSSVTHGFNMGQRFIELTPVTLHSDGSGLDVPAPANSKVAPPGYYMLFVLNSSGVPSLARIIQLHT